MAIDRIDWHSGADDFPSDLKPEAGGTHIGMFIAWILNNNLEGELHRKESLASISKVKSREITGTEFLINECDEKFWEDDLSKEGLEFTKFYYESDKYLSDYETALVTNQPSTYHVLDTWDNYDKLSVRIDEAYKSWKIKV